MGTMTLVKVARSIRQNLVIYSFVIFTSGILVGKMYPMPLIRLLIPIALLLMLFPAFLDIDRQQLSHIAARPLPFLMALFFNILLSPVLMYGLIKLMPGSSTMGVTVGLLIFGMIPAGGMGPAYTGMLHGNVNLSIAISAVSLLLTLGAVPFWSWMLIDRIVTVPIILISEYLFMIILLPLTIAVMARYWVTRRFGKPVFHSMKRMLRDLSVIGLLLMLFIIAVINGRFISESPVFIMKLILPTASFSLLLLITATASGLAFRLPYKDRVALTIGATAKNTAIAMALATAAFSGWEALSIAVAGPLVQLPVMLCYLHILTRFSARNRKIVKDRI